MHNFVSVIICTLFLFCFYLMGYSVFYREFSDDIEMKHGRRTLARFYGSRKVGLLRRFVFWDFRKSLNKIHYALFWINLVSFATMISGMIVQLLLTHHIGEKVMTYSIIANIITSTIPQLTSRSMHLYSENKVKRRYWRKHRR